VHHPTEELPPPPEPVSDEFPAQQPLDEPSSAENALPPDTGGDEVPQLYDFETDEAALDEPAPAAAEPEDAFEELGPAEEQPPFTETEERDAAPAEVEDEPRPDETGEEDLLSASPEFLDEEDPGTDEEDLWFEKGPPKDFDFDDEK
jgi:hypothetical protein